MGGAGPMGGGQDTAPGAADPTAATVTMTPESLPWLIRLDKYVDGQSMDGVTELVVRSNSSETALNEAVALDLLAEAGLVTEDAALVRLSVNGSAQNLDRKSTRLNSSH